MTWTDAEVNAALSRAVDDVLEEIGAGEQGVRDVGNLIQNAALTYLKSPSANLHDVAAACYSVPLETILEWCDA